MTTKPDATNHTPGNWRVSYCGRSHWIIETDAPQTETRRSSIIAEIKDPIGYMTRQENRDNADLMASAPALLVKNERLSDLLERARIILAEECGDNFCAQVLVSEIESELNATPKGGAK